jgi:hypothetical protein
MPPPRVALFAEQGHFTAVHNLTFRVVMPQLSSSAWKVLCFLISETVGYNRRSELISYASIKAGTGIKSSATVSKSLTELLADEPFGCPLIVRQVGAKCGAASHESARYGLNLKCTVALQKTNRGSSKSEPRHISRSSDFEPTRGSENEPLMEAPIRNAGALIETSNEPLSRETSEESQIEAEVEPEFPYPVFRTPYPTESEHFTALCEVCQLDADLISARRKSNATQRAAQLATKYTPEQIRLAGSRWPLPTAPHPDQLLDSIQALLNRKERHDSNASPTESPRNETPRNEHQRNATERREFMGELARRFG